MEFRILLECWSMSEEKMYCKIPPRLIEKYGKNFPFDVFLKLGPTNIIKISHGDEDITEIYKKYRSRGVEDIYALEHEYKKFINYMRKAIKNKFFDESTIDDRVTTLDSCYGVAKEPFKKLALQRRVLLLLKI